MFFLFPDIILAPDIIINHIEHVSPKKIKLHFGEMCAISLEGEYQDITENNFESAINKNRLSKKDIIQIVRKFKDEQMCDFLYYDDSLSCKENKIKVSVGKKINIEYSGEERRIRKGPQISFPLQFTSNIKYDPFTHYRIYLPKGPIKAVVFDIYGGGIDRLYYPFFVSSKEVSSQKWSLITHYKKLFRGFVDQGVAVVTLRLADCRVDIRDQSYVQDKEQLFIYKEGNRLSFKHQAYFFLENDKRKTQEMDILKREIKNFMDAFPKILPEAKDAPTIFLGMSFGGIVGLFIVQDKESENWFDHYVLIETPTRAFKGVLGDTIYNPLAKMDHLERRLFLAYADLDHRIYGEHDQFFLNKIKNKDLVTVYHMPEIGHDLPNDPHPLIQEILKFCQIDKTIENQDNEADNIKAEEVEKL